MLRQYDIIAPMRICPLESCNEKIKRKEGIFCSRKCMVQDRINTARKRNCDNTGCHNLVFLMKTKATSDFSYCSHRCAGQMNNRKYPRRSPFRKTGKAYGDGEIFCKCGNDKTLYSYDCIPCFKAKQKIINYNKTFSQTFISIKEKCDNESHRYYTMIRTSARRQVHLFEMDETCLVCGYSTFVELAHIKAISKFKDKATLREINAKSNLCYLCPNCHKEFDRHLMKEENVKVIKEWTKTWKGWEPF